MDLFEMMKEKKQEENAPLAYRLRPKKLEDIVGQDHILAKDKMLYRIIKADKLSSIILYGPPGTGKTTIARVIAASTKAYFMQLNATGAGKKDIQDIIERAEYNLGMTGKKTILFIDEIHRFNKAQQDTLLPYVEDGSLVLIGATTENPYFEVNKALISRSLVFSLTSLSPDNIKTLIKRAIDEEFSSYGKIIIDEEAKDFFANMSGGDARIALNALELAVLTSERNSQGEIFIDLKVASDCIQKRPLNYDKKGDNHYDIISAFIKSMRGSHPDAAIYYLARMLYAGEDPKFIARRIIICASEDVGNADPRALSLAVAAADALQFVGMPEARIILSQVVAYVASAPKSNASYLAIDKALDDVKNIRVDKIPSHLKDAHYKGAKDLGHGIGYKYAHNFENNYVDQEYLPDEIRGAKYYQPTDNGYEKNIKEWFKKIGK